MAATSPVSAGAARAPGAVVGGGLQAYLIGVGETINVNTDQDATQSWSHTISGSTTYTIQFQSSPNAAIQQFGLYNASAVIPPLFFLMSGSVGPPGILHGHVQAGQHRDREPVRRACELPEHDDVRRRRPEQLRVLPGDPERHRVHADARNPGGLARAISFQGTGANAGTWWLCWDEPARGRARRPGLRRPRRDV
jgi:hypothetical protein